MSDSKQNGGTSFNVAIEAILKKNKPATGAQVLIFTDGEISADNRRAEMRQNVAETLKHVQGLDEHSAAVLTEHLVDKLPKASGLYTSQMIPVVSEFVAERNAAHTALGIDQPELTAPEMIVLSEKIVATLHAKVRENRKPLVFLSFDQSGSI